jgi:hypothetical protein
VVLGSGRGFDMGPRLTIRSLVWGFCLAIVLLGARSARAAAPMCDETASSRIAPPPVLPIRDVKLEAGYPCDAFPMGSAPVTVVPVGPRAPASPAVSSDAASIEGWVRPSAVPILRATGLRTRVRPEASADAKPGFSLGVFRPPRV